MLGIHTYGNAFAKRCAMEVCGLESREACWEGMVFGKGKGREGGPGSRFSDKSVKIGWRKDTFERSGRCGIMPYLFGWFERDVFEFSNSSSAALDYRSPSQQCVGISALPVHDGNFEA